MAFCQITRRLYLQFILVMGVGEIAAQDVVNMPDVTKRPTAQSTGLSTEPKIDGEVLQDEVWQAVTPIDQLWQTKPNAGLPASEKTEIRIGYTTTTFYLSVVCYDAEPQRLVVSDARRDATLDNTDSFLFILDTYHDGQNGFIFGTNSLGIEYDGQVDNEGQGNFSVARLQAGVIGGFNDNHIWSEYFDRRLSDLLGIQSEVAQQIASKLEVKIKPATKAIIEQIPTSNPEAYDLYLKAVHLRFDLDSLEQYRALLEKAIALDPQFASPYSELGYYWLANWHLPSHEIIQKVEPLLNKAISLNPSETWAHINLGYLNLWYKWDFFAAEREFAYAAQLEPSNINAMDTDVKVSMGRFSEAVKLARQQKSAEPNTAGSNVVLGFTLYFNGQYSESLVFLDSASRAEAPSDAMGEMIFYGDLGRAYLYLGKDKKVVEVLEKAVMISAAKGFMVARHKGTLAIALIHLGKHERATQLLNELKQLSTEGPAGSPLFYVAMVYAQLGETDQAFNYLEKSFAKHEVEMYWLKVEPPFKPLHKDPRWQAMLDKVGFPK